jgi:intracellular septation protein A
MGDEKAIDSTHARQRADPAAAGLVASESRWALFFILCGLANIYIAFWLPQNIWVNFKVFGLTALTLVFTLLSGVYIYRHMPQDDNH